MGRKATRSGITDYPTNSMWGDAPGRDSPYPPPRGISHVNLASMFFDSSEDRESQCFARYRDPEDGEWTSLSWGEVVDRVCRLAGFLRSGGLARGSGRVLISGRGLGSLIADLAVLSVGGTSVFVGGDRDAERRLSILDACRPSYAFWGTEEEGREMESELGPRHPLSENSSCVSELIAVDPKGESRCLANVPAGKIPGIKAFARGIPAGGARAVFATSSTVENGFAVLRSHEEDLAAVNAVLLSGLLLNGRDFLFAPRRENAFSRIMCFSAIASGGEIIFPAFANEGGGKDDKGAFTGLSRDIRDTRPRVLLLPGDYLESIHSGIRELGSSGIRGRLASWASENYQALSALVASGGAPGVGTTLRFIAARLIAERLLSPFLGPRPKALVSEEEISRDTEEFFESLGVPLLRVSTAGPLAPLISANTSVVFRAGTLGRRFVCSDIRIDERGLLLVEGRHVSKRILGMDPPYEESARAATAVETALRVRMDDGWLIPEDGCSDAPLGSC